MKKIIIKSFKVSITLVVIAILLIVGINKTSAGSCSSAGTGAWATGGTWGAGCTGAGGIPAAGDNVTILNGHNVTIATGVSGVATNITINSGGTLTITSTGTLSASGNYINNGTNAGTGDLNLTGVGTTIDGTGTNTLTGTTTITNSKTINSTANLAFSGPLTISSGDVTNNGTVSVTGNLTVSSVLNIIGNSITVSGDVINSGTLNVNSATQYYRSITIDHTKVPNTDQTDFPVVIAGTYSYLATIPNGGKVQNANGYDVGFYSDSALTTKLKWETEKYTATTGEVVYWVKIPSLSHTSDTVIYMGYGNPGITTDQSDSANTWNSNFKSVWHMKETLTSSGQTVADSTSNAINLTSQGAWSSGQQVAGVVGGALNPLSANSDYLSFASQSLSSAYTIEGWVKITSQGAASVLFGNGGGGTNDTNWFAGAYRLWSGSADEITSPNTTSTGVWKHFAITRTGTSLIMYENGSQVQTSSNGANKTFQYLGQGDGNLTSDIYFDEVRISTSVRSADWLATEYNNENSPSTFYSVGGESTLIMAITPSTGSYYRTITIDHTKVPNTDQTDFPILITGTYAYLATVANGGKVQNANGYDVGFYSDSALTTKLKWETVSYNATTGSVEYWVKIPTLSHTTDTVLYMGYGNSSISSDQSDKVNVWDSGFRGVLHFGDGTTLSTTDSSSYAVGSGTNNSVTATTGKVGGAGNFSSANINYGNNFGSAMTGDFTITYWGNATYWGQVINKSFSGNGQGRPFDMYELYTGQQRLFVGDGSTSTALIESAAAATSVWKKYTWKMSGNNWSVRIDGANDNSGTFSQSRSNSTDDFLVGHNNANTEWFAGKIDELRLSSTARSDDWDTTEYNNESSPSTFYTVGSEVAPPSTTVTITVGGNWTNTGTFTPGTSTIKMNYNGSSGITFAGGGQTYYNLWLAHGSGTGDYTISGNNTFRDFKDDGTGTHSILFTTGSTQHVTTWNVSGTSGHLITINSTTTGTHSLVKDGGGAINVDYLNIQHSVATPKGTWFAGSNSTDNNSVATAGSGWFFKLEKVYRGGGGSSESSGTPDAAHTGGGGEGGGSGVEGSGGSGKSTGGGEGGGGDTGFMYNNSNLAFVFGAFNGFDLIDLFKELFR